MERMTIIQIIKKEYSLNRGVVIDAWDFEDEKWIKTEVQGFTSDGKVKLKSVDGLEWEETPKELSDPNLYKFPNQIGKR